MPLRPCRKGGPVVLSVHLEGTLAQLFLLASLLFGLMYSPHAREDTPMPARPSVCDGASMITAANLDTKAQQLNKSISELKLRLSTASDPVEIAKLTHQLEELQKELLDLIFAQECVRTDYSIQILRGPGDTAPPWVEITTFFATNRAATGSTAPDNYFGAERQQLLQFGKTVVSIPTNRKPGTLDLPSLWKFELTADPKKHFIFKEIIPLQADAAHTEMSKIIAASGKKSLLIFVHGFNVTFSDAALRTAQLAHDLAFPGTAVFFSWPSVGEARSYWRDEEVVQLSQAAFDQFLDQVSNIGATEIYLIAHSMGNRLVTTVLKDRAAKGKLIPNLKELFLAAPDINAEIFQEIIVPGLASLQGVHRTIYASSTDLALRASKVVHDYRRVGDTDGGVFTFDGFETIDASSVAPVLRAFGHSYVVDSTKVIGDISETLTMHFTADQRSLQRLGSAPRIWWTLE